MDALDDVVAQCLALVAGPDPAPSISAWLAGADLKSLHAGLATRPQPWLVHADADLTVFATNSAPGTGSAPHDHGLWAVVACLTGREGSRLYEQDDGSLTEIGRSCLDVGEVRVLPEDTIHAVFNCWTEPNVVLHVYGGDFLAAPKSVWDPITNAVAERTSIQPLVPVDPAR